MNNIEKLAIDELEEMAKTHPRTALQTAYGEGVIAGKALQQSSEPVAEKINDVALNVKSKNCHLAADAFWQSWRENGKTHKRGYYEATWGAINEALRLCGVVEHEYFNPKIKVACTTYLSDIDKMTPPPASVPLEKYNKLLDALKYYAETAHIYDKDNFSFYDPRQVAIKAIAEVEANHD